MFDPDDIPIENPHRGIDALRRELVKLDAQLAAAPNSGFIQNRHAMYTSALRAAEKEELEKWRRAR